MCGSANSPICARLGRHVGQDDRHSMQRDPARRRRHPLDRAHERVDASGRAFARRRARKQSRSRRSRRRRRRVQLAKRHPELHRGHDVAARRIEEHDAAQAGDVAADSRIRRRRAACPASITPSATMTSGHLSAAGGRFHPRHAKSHRALLGPRRRRERQKPRSPAPRASPRATGREASLSDAAAGGR